jgi:hypothetical protein
MKKILIVALFLIITGASISPAYSLDISLGLSGWYSTWTMEETGDGDGGLDLKPAILYGPVAAFRFHKELSLSTFFLYGKFTPENSDDTGDLTRYDSDTALNYDLFKYLKIFGGFKFIGFRWKGSSGDGKHQSLGPALGLGITLHTIGNLYLLGNLSGFYGWGSHEDHREEDGSIYKNSADMDEYGFNSNISLAYYIAPASTTLTAGFRFQRFWTKYTSSEEQNRDMRHDFYGVTLTAIYSFSIKCDE